MTELTVKMLAAEIKISVDHLLKQFADVGIPKSAEDEVTLQQKQELLMYLNRKCNSHPDQLILQRRTRSTLKISNSSGKRRSIQIEIRKKRTFIKHDLKELEYLVSETQEQKESKAIDLHTEEKTDELNKKSKTLYEIEENKYTEQRIYSEDSKKDNKSKLKTNETIDILQIGKNRRDKKIVDMKHKEEIFSRSKKEVQSMIEKASYLDKKDKNNWDDTIDSIEDNHSGHHLTISQHIRRVSDENDCIGENGRCRGRHTKATRHKRSNKRFEYKNNHEEDRTFRENKEKKRKYSSLHQSFQKPIQTISRDVVIGETITVCELANKMAVKSSHLIKMMIKLGYMITINQLLDQETAQLVAEEMGHRVILCRENELEESIINDRDTGDISELRAPIVTIMGHVDHGKTSILDYIRSTRVASSEAGGITQHIGAYHVETKNGKITFLDTPGHAAFSAMRVRGVQATDIVVLVVAADDGVMPQTIESIQYVQKAQVPMVIAVNKIDKSGSDLDRVRNELAKYNIIPDEWGGDYQFVYVSARKGIGIDDLLNAIFLQSEILELKSIHKGMAKGSVIESSLRRGLGPVATVLVREGTLKRGDIVLCGFEYGRIRAMRNDLGKVVTEAGPSIPVEIFGLSGIPMAGDEMTVVRDEKKAREVALYRQGKFREVKLACQKKSKSENLFSDDIVERKLREVNLVLKADVQGSVEAISDCLLKLSTNEVKVRIVSSGVGRITETDAVLACASKAILLGFNVGIDIPARSLIEAENLYLRQYSVIYNLIDEVKKIVVDTFSPELQREIIGLAEVRDVFISLKFGTIAGCIITKGLVKRHNPIRILRNNIVIHEGELESLRRFKNDVSEVHNGMECGVGIKNYHDIRIGDVIEVFEIKKIQYN